MPDDITPKVATVEIDHRSLLFLPASVVADPTHPLPDYYRRCASGRLPAEFRADIFILDLEDSVAASARDTSFSDAAAFFDQASDRLQTSVFLRVTGTQVLRDREVELALHPGVAGIVIPKVERDTVDQVGAGLFDLGKPVWPIIETAKGFIDKSQIIKHVRERQRDSSAICVILGRDDLAASLRMDREYMTPERFASFFLDFVCACRAEGCDPIGPVFNELENATGLIQELSSLRMMGFGGSLCVFPNQVKEVNRAFAFVTSELRSKYASIREALTQASKKGLGWIIFNGRKYDTADLAYIDFVLSKEG